MIELADIAYFLTRTIIEILLSNYPLMSRNKRSVYFTPTALARLNEEEDPQTLKRVIDIGRNRKFKFWACDYNGLCVLHNMMTFVLVSS